MHLHFRRSAHSFSLGDLPLVFGVLFSTPIDLVIAGLVGPIVVLLVDRRLPAIKVVFNIAQFTLTTCLAVILFHELAATADGFGPLTWIYALIACQVSALVTVLLIGGAISLSEGRLGARALGRMLLMDLTVTTTNTSLALAGAVIVVYDPRALPLLVVPLVTVFLAYRAYATERQRHESLEFLYETTRTLSRSPEIVGALEGLLARSVEAFRAEIAEIVLFPSEGNPPLRTTLGPDDVTTSCSRSSRRSPTSCARWSTRTSRSRASAPIRAACGCAATSRSAASRTRCWPCCRARRASWARCCWPTAPASCASSPTPTCGCSRRWPPTPRSRSSTTASSRPSGSCASSSASSSTRPTTTR